MYKKSKGVGQSQTLVEGALVLTIGIALVKLIGAVFKIPLGNIIGESGMGYFSSAYNLYLPVYTAASAGLPAALARQVSENMTLGRYKDVRRVHKIAKTIFLCTGIIGFLVMVGIGVYATTYGSFNQKAIYSILAMCPSVFFCCMMSGYRGYNEGLRNMVPTATSQVIEALGKLIIGLGAAVIVVKWAEHKFDSAMNIAGAAAAGTVKVNIFGTVCTSKTEALNAAYPFATACALLGITLGSAFALLYLLIRYKRGGVGITAEQYELAPEPEDTRVILSKFLKIGIPIAMGVLALNLTQLIDSFQIQAQLAKLDMNALRASYGTHISSVAMDEDIPNFLWGVYNYGITLYNLVPYLTQALGVSALPALAAAWVNKDKPRVEQSVNSVVKIGVLLAFPAGLGLFSLAPNILDLLYHGKAAAVICIPILRTLGIMAIFGALAAPLNSMLQAVGKQMVPVKLMAVGAVIKLVMNYILVGVQDINIKGAPYGSLACYAFMFVGSVIILLRTTNVKLNMMSTFVKPFTAAALCAFAAWGGAALLDGLVGNRIATLGAICIAVVVYVISLFALKALTRDDILSLPKGEKIAKILEKRGLIV